MMKATFQYLSILVLLGLASCQQQKKDEGPNKAQEAIAEVSKRYAPDGRVALFKVKAVKNDENYVLKGETNLPEALTSLEEKLKSENLSYTDSIQLLPNAKALEGKTRGVIKTSVANLRDEPKHSAQLVTQATLGTPVEVYKKRGSWYYIQTPDKYLAWVDYGGIKTKNDSAFSSWKASKKLIYLKPYGNSYEKTDKASQTVSDLVAGDILEISNEKNGFYEVTYPDGQNAFVAKSEAKPYLEWLDNLPMNKESLVSTSKELMGLPYLWGGTSPKGVDCSGFTKTVYFLNGMVIPRDASQQVHTGKLIDSTRNFENLIPGDLLFFGKPATDSTSERIIHVGMWIGDNKFIHSMGNVHISTMDTTAADFDEYNYNRYLRTKRVFKQKGQGLQYLRNKNIFTEDKAGEKDSIQ